MTDRLLVWQVVETAGFDSAWVRLDGGGLMARGRATGQLPTPYWLEYVLETDPGLGTRRLQVTSDQGDGTALVDVQRGDDGWTVEGTPRPDLDDALDIDIEACPLTNMMPIVRERCHTEPGQADLMMAFVEVPSLQVVPSVQRYEHLRLVEDGAVVRFSSGSFTSDLHIDSDGFVIDYPSLGTRLYLGS